MREEYKKSSEIVDGVEVADLGDEYVFTLENKAGVSKEFHLTRPLKSEEFLEEYVKEKKEEMENGV